MLTAIKKQRAQRPITMFVSKRKPLSLSSPSLPTVLPKRMLLRILSFPAQPTLLSNCQQAIFHHYYQVAA